ncbi:MAG: hypothetical protein Phog2KO_26470 [Phototrophicaceae bacterium]
MADNSQANKPSNTFKAVALLSFRALVGAYALNTLLHITATLLFGEQWVIIEFFNTFAQILWLPTFILIPLCLMMREWRLSLMMLPAMMGFIVLWGALFMPNTLIEPQANDIPLRVMSYNLYTGNQQVVDYTQIISDTSPDIIGLQELNFTHTDIFTNEFSATYPYTAFNPSNSTQGQGFMSVYPIIEEEYWRYDFLPQSLGHQRLVLQIDNDTQITVYNIHPTHPAMNGHFFNPEFRSQEIADLLDRASREVNPVIILGDFNMPDFSEDYRSIRQNFDDAFYTAGFGLGWTFPRIEQFNSAFLRLDYIFYSEDFSAQSASVNRGYTGSDHNNLYADMLILAGEG